MTATIARTANASNFRGARTCTIPTESGTINSAIAGIIREIYASKTAETLAAWLKIAVRTAKHRLAGSREFTIDELAALIHSEHGFRVLSAIMAQAKRPPSWWSVCEPLMDLADAELLVQAIRDRTNAAIIKREEDADALETEIRRTQTLAIHGSGPARAQHHALQSISRSGGRLVAPKVRGGK
jgi:hypothetical protein